MNDQELDYLLDALLDRLVRRLDLTREQRSADALHERFLAATQRFREMEGA